MSRVYYSDFYEQSILLRWMKKETCSLSCTFRIYEVCESLKMNASQLTFARPKYKLIENGNATRAEIPPLF